MISCQALTFLASFAFCFHSVVVCFPHPSLTSRLSFPAPVPSSSLLELQTLKPKGAGGVTLSVERKCDQFYAKWRKLSNVYVQQFLTHSTRLPTDVQVQRIGQQKRKKLLTKPDKEWNGEGETVYKSDNESPFSVMKNSFETARISQNVLSQPRHLPRTEVWAILAAVSIHRRPNEPSSIDSWTPSWRISPRNERRCRCMSVRATVSRVEGAACDAFSERNHI